MKNRLLLYPLTITCFFCFNNCKNSSVPNNKQVDNAGLTDKQMVINWVRDGNSTAPTTTLDNVRVIRKRSATPDMNLTYNMQPIQIPVRAGDELLFIKDGKEQVHLKMDVILHLTHIGVVMFIPATSVGETIEGMVMGRNNAPIEQLPITIGQETIMTDSNGYYTKTFNPGSSFTIQYSRRTSTTEKNAIITANTTNDGGKVVIDVAFDEDGMFGSGG